MDIKNKEKKENTHFLALSFAWNLGYSIAIPLILFALGGRLLDKKLNTSPIFFLSGIIFSIFLSSFIVYKKSIKIISAFDKKTEKKD